MGNIVAASARAGQPARKPLVDRYRRGPPVLVAGDKSPVRPVATPPSAPRRGKPGSACGAPAPAGSFSGSWRRGPANPIRRARRPRGD